ncbi:hypothetical protein ACH42_04695 [Endozoicomonas sp. (ex Bugula neritina AB1)]|nr:hypothetical protein ACH42_04695 [Endozoicomonas sp. (ex Bugula neritina AB1)]
MDQLSRILNQYSITTGIFYSGRLCGLSSFDKPEEQAGHIHLLRQGSLVIQEAGKKEVTLSEPTLVFYPRPVAHFLKPGLTDMAEVVCIEVHYGTGPDNPLANSLPSVIYLPFSQNSRIQNASEWLFEEAFSKALARQLVMNRICELLTIQLLRHALSSGQVNGGLLAGLTHPKLSKLLDAIHHEPAKQWSLKEMAQVANMSRARFALQFRATVGQTPGDFLTGLRVNLAQKYLRQEKPVGWTANEVGYDNASGLARAFRSKTGQSPKEWQKNVLADLADQ